MICPHCGKLIVRRKLFAESLANMGRGEKIAAPADMTASAIQSAMARVQNAYPGRQYVSRKDVTSEVRNVWRIE